MKADLGVSSSYLALLAQRTPVRFIATRRKLLNDRVSKIRGPLRLEGIPANGPDIHVF